MTYFFYDVETSGISPKQDRIIQFAGQRTNAELQLLGDPINSLIKLSKDILPDPEAVLINGITPQMTIAEGLTEAEFLRLFTEKVVAPDTVYLGFNSIHFDDEFMRFLHYRNFYSAYDWQQADGCSRWDLLDVTRMTRALRPEGIEWPIDSTGQPSNRLELLASANKLEHINAHDALSDVKVTIALAQLLRRQQPKLFDFLQSISSKSAVSKLVLSDQPLVYCGYALPSEYFKTTVVAPLDQLPKNIGSVVYDLRYDPSKLLKLTPEELAKLWPGYHQKDLSQPWPVSTIRYNQCPALAPLGVLDKASQKRLQLDMDKVEQNYQLIKKSEEFAANLIKAYELIDQERQKEWASEPTTVDGQLYDGFFNDHDKGLLPAIQHAEPEKLDSFSEQLNDPRLKALLPLYKARNFPTSLKVSERAAWDNYCQKQLFAGAEHSRLARYLQRIQDLAAQNPTANKTYLLEELKLYGESIIPTETTDE
jgi:exodeoxyribonuclease-1